MELYLSSWGNAGVQSSNRSHPHVVPQCCRSNPSPSCCSSVLVRYVRSDGKLHTVNLHHAALADGRSHSIILRLGGLQRASMNMELYVDCRLADSSQGLPSLVPLPQEAELVELRHGQKAYARLQVRLRTAPPLHY